MNHSSNPFSTDFETWCLIQGLNEKTIKVLLQEDLVTPDVLEMLSIENIKELSLSMGQRKYLEKAISSLQGNSFTESISSSQEVSSSPVLFSGTCRSEYTSQNESRAKTQIESRNKSQNESRNILQRTPLKSQIGTLYESQIDAVSSSTNFEREFFTVDETASGNDNNDMSNDNDVNYDNNSDNDNNKYNKNNNNNNDSTKNDNNDNCKNNNNDNDHNNDSNNDNDDNINVSNNNNNNNNNNDFSTFTGKDNNNSTDFSVTTLGKSDIKPIISIKSHIIPSTTSTYNTENNAFFTHDSTTCTQNNTVSSTLTEELDNFFFDDQFNEFSTRLNLVGPKKRVRNSKGDSMNHIASPAKRNKNDTETILDNSSISTSGNMMLNKKPSTSRIYSCDEIFRNSDDDTLENVPSTSKKNLFNNGICSSANLIDNIPLPSRNSSCSEIICTSDNIFDIIPSTSTNYNGSARTSGKIFLKDAPSTSTVSFCNKDNHTSSSATLDNIPLNSRNRSCNNTARSSGIVSFNDCTRVSDDIMDNIPSTNRNSSCNEGSLEPNDTSSSFLEDHDEVDDYIMHTQLHEENEENEEFERQRLQEQCDFYLDQTDQDHNTRYQVVLYGQQWCFICGYCKEKGPLVLGSGLGHFRQHIQSLTHINKRGIHQGLRRLEETTRDQVFTKLDSRIFQISKNGKIMCKLCKTSFENAMSGKSLEKKIQQHIDSKEHKLKMRSISKTKTVDSFFQKT